MSKATQAPVDNETKTLNANNEISTEIQELLKQAKAEAEKIVNDAKQVAEDIKKAAESAAVTVPSAPQKTSDNEELVEVELFKDSGKYKDDVYVAVNGERVQIQRGVPVKIKKKFYKVLEASRKQDIATAKFIQEKVDEFEAESKRRNI